MYNEDVSLTEQLEELKSKLISSDKYDELKKKAMEERRKFDKFSRLVTEMSKQK